MNGSIILNFNLLRLQKEGFTMLEIMIVITIMGIIVAIAHHTWIRQREVARSRACQENLAKIDGAKELYAMDKHMGQGEAIGGGMGTLVGATNYIKREPHCPADGSYEINVIGENPTCDYPSVDWAPMHEIP